MKTLPLVGAVLGVHAVVVGVVLVSQGCRTAGEVAPAPAPDTQTVVMPPPAIPPEPPVIKPPEPHAKTWPAKTTVYEVAKGDTLDRIARRFNLRGSEIASINGITNPNKIRVGQKLMLPGDIDIKAPPKQKTSTGSKKSSSGAKKSTGSKSESNTVAADEGGNVYVVQPNDSLGKIAARKGTTVSALKKANNLTSDVIRQNQKLIIPGATEKASKTAVAADTKKGVEAEKKATSDLPPLPVGDSAKNTGKTAVKSADKATDKGTDRVVPPAPDGASDVSAPKTFRTHKVEEGEDLKSIALLWTVDVADIRKANNLTSDAVKTGDVLKIPIAAP